MLTRPGGMYSGLLLLLPLLLPLLAAAVFQSGVLPEISVLKPAGLGFSEGSDALLRVLRVTDAESGTSAFYSISGSPGAWLIVVGLTVTSFMLLRRLVGVMMVRRLLGRCTAVKDAYILEIVENLSVRAGLRSLPEVLMLPAGLSGAFVTGLRRAKILLSEDLLEGCGRDELEGIIAHEIAHIEAHDVQLASTSGLLRDVVAWNPFAHLAHRKLCADREYEADRRAADLTGDPLSVASGLLKAVEMMNGRSRLQHRAVLAFLRPGRLISRRIDGLIAVADGRASISPAGQFPFVVAGLLVALIGLQVGNRMASEESALAILWGESHRSGGVVWEAPIPAKGSGADGKKTSGKVSKGKVKRSKPKGKADLQTPVRLLGLAEVVSVKETDLELWMDLVDRRVQRAGLQAVTVRWEARRQYRAVPLISRLPFGIYRIHREL